MHTFVYCKTYKYSFITMCLHLRLKQDSRRYTSLFHTLHKHIAQCRDNTDVTKYGYGELIFDSCDEEQG